MDITNSEQKRFLSLLEIVQLLVAAYNAINIFASSRIAAADWPKLLPAHIIQNRKSI